MAAVERLLRGRDRVFAELFDRAGDNVAAAATLLDELLAEFPDKAGHAQRIAECERTGNQITTELARRLNEAVATPVDRDDILNLASALDDVVDGIDQAAQYLGLYSIEAPMLQSHALAGILVEATGVLASAIRGAIRFEDIRAETVEVHRLENEGDRIVRGAIASLFEGGIDPMVVIRWKDIFERLEDAIDATERAAFVLEGIVIKNA